MHYWFGLLLSALLWIPLHATTIDWHVTHQAPDGSVQTTITQQLAKGWHTYWKYPGDSGAKATISIISPHIATTELIFPEPQIIMEGDLRTYGYKNQVRYELGIASLDSAGPITATFNWLECHNICVPKTKKITLTIPNDPLPTLQSPAPLPHIIVTQTGKTLKFTLPASIKRAAFYPYKTAPFHADTGTLKSGQLHVPLTHRQHQVITGELFMDNHPPIKIHQRPRLLTSSYGPIIGALLGAFLGGLLLNIMPCVLPIIGIKALQFQRSKHIPGWRDAVYYFLGVWGTLITLYLLLVGLKSMGHLSGWGFQLQSPIIIQCLILLFIIIMAINLELMHIPLPKKISQKKHPHMMAYGAMTTLIATPCTAPFLGTALAAALLTSSVVGFGIFTSMAFGLSLPMALIITRPSWRRWLPTSGHWNRRLKFYLNGGFVITIGWFFWVLSSQISMGFYTIFLSVITLFLFVLYWRHPIAIPKQHLLPVILTVIMGLIPLINPAPSNRVWQPYSPAIIESLIANQTPYFIDVTAKWCITCQTNKLTVLNTQKAIKYFNKKNIQLFRADWTNHSPTVTSLLAQFDKISIPTYVYFDGETHHVFGDILTMNKLKEHVK